MRHKVLQSTGGMLAGLTLVLVPLLLLVTNVPTAEAIPAWARKYRTSCTTCHAPYPKLNYFGKAFRNNGYRFPGGLEASATKEPPVIMGAEGYKKLFPHAMWPSDIPGAVPLAVRGTSRLNFSDADTTTFEFPHEFELFSGGTLGENFSFFNELEFENEDNETEIGVGLSLQIDPRPWLHIRIGTVSPHPIPDRQRLTAAHYSSVYDTRTTPKSLTLSALNPNGSTATLSMQAKTGEDRWRFRNDQSGVEVFGALNGRNDKGGLTWAFGVANGQGRIDSNDRKDVYGRVAFKFGGFGELGSDVLPQNLEFWRDDSFKAGFFFYDGESLNTYDGSLTVLSGSRGTGLTTVSTGKEIVNQFDVAGVNFDWWFRDLNLFGLYLRQTDDDPLGTGEGIDTHAWFAEADYTALPWLVGILRFGETYQDFDFSPDPGVRQIFVPAVNVMVRANIKFTFEAQLRLDSAGGGRDKYVTGIDYAF